MIGSILRLTFCFILCNPWASSMKSDKKAACLKNTVKMLGFKSMDDFCINKITGSRRSYHKEYGVPKHEVYRTCALVALNSNARQFT